MAGDWLKMRHDLADDPAVIRLAAACSIDEDAVIGKLFRLWSWADRHTIDGVADGIGLAWVDRVARCEGFGAALVRVGWLVESDSGLSFPKFDRHCSDTAKQRALGKDRMKRARDADVALPAQQKRNTSVTKASPEKRREEVPPPPREASLSWEEFRKRWNDGAGARWAAPEPPPGWEERIAEAGWLDQAVEAISRLPGCKFFTTPVSLKQFCGPAFVRLCLGGQYDTPKTGRGAGLTPDGKLSAAALAERFHAPDPEKERKLAEFIEAKKRRAAV